MLTKLNQLVLDYAPKLPCCCLIDAHWTPGKIVTSQGATSRRFLAKAKLQPYAAVRLVAGTMNLGSLHYQAICVDIDDAAIYCADGVHAHDRPICVSAHVEAVHGLYVWHPDLVASVLLCAYCEEAPGL